MSNKQVQDSSYSQVYKDLQKTILYHRRDSYLFCMLFLSLQYSIPLLSALLTAFIGARMFDNNIVLVMSIILTVLGSLNSVLKPAESYEWSATFSNKFQEFDNNFNLSMIELRARQDSTETEYIQLLRKVNRELAVLIDERNKRQLLIFKSPMVQSESEVLNQTYEE